ncbi:hypothetical protein RF11_09671 [Thelohanellus kitauei]|uniref:Uncharacterized protein n=1 Tax=Thelohanellus kitauei TaxID=669202 RepID=A0A0C2N1Z7_THEKT|nr:hypothetical protein RF11_09671 [Thelohanellus kitauei]
MRERMYSEESTMYFPFYKGHTFKYKYRHHLEPQTEGNERRSTMIYSFIFIHVLIVAGIIIFSLASKNLFLAYPRLFKNVHKRRNIKPPKENLKIRVEEITAS